PQPPRHRPTPHQTHHPRHPNPRPHRPGPPPRRVTTRRPVTLQHGPPSPPCRFCSRTSIAQLGSISIASTPKSFRNLAAYHHRTYRGPGRRLDHFSSTKFPNGFAVPDTSPFAAPGLAARPTFPRPGKYQRNDPNIL